MSPSVRTVIAFIRFPRDRVLPSPERREIHSADCGRLTWKRQYIVRPHPSAAARCYRLPNRRGKQRRKRRTHSIISLVNSLPICTTAAIRALEEQAADAPLMELAGAAAAGQARLLAPRVADPVTVFAGPGNNGGDAFVVARHLREWGYAVTVVFCAEPEGLPAAARNAHDRWRAAGGTTQSSPPALSECGLVVDGLFGIGLGRALTGTYAEWIAAINRADCPVLALDIPSGLDADTGACSGPVVQATHTATFIALKPGLLTADGVDAAGKVTLHDLGIDARRMRRPMMAMVAMATMMATAGSSPGRSRATGCTGASATRTRDRLERWG